MWKQTAAPPESQGSAHNDPEALFLFLLQRNALQVFLLEIILSKDTNLPLAFYL